MQAYLEIDQGHLVAVDYAVQHEQQNAKPAVLRHTAAQVTQERAAFTRQSAGPDEVFRVHRHDCAKSLSASSGTQVVGWPAGLMTK